MQRNVANSTETVQITYFHPKQVSPQDVNIQSLLLPIPFGTGDVALAAMVKGLQEFYLEPMKVELNETIELDPMILSSIEKILTSFKEDLKRSKDLKPSGLIGV